MKKFIIILITLAFLVGCTSSNNKPSDGTLIQNIQKYDINNESEFKVVITETARNKMLNDLSKSTNAGKTYSIKYSYPGSGWGTPIYDIVLEEQSNNNEEGKLFNINSINVIVPNSLLGYINGLEVDYAENAEGNLTLKIIY